MQESRKNVVEFSRSRSGAGNSGAGLLNECGEMAASRLGEALSKTLKDAANELLELTDQVIGYETRRIYGEAREFARDKREEVEGDFRKRFYQRYKRECRRDQHSRDSGKGDIDASQLSLQEPDDLEESLASSTIANALNNTCGEELFGLSKRMGVLLEDPELQLGDYPLSPEVIGETVMDCLKAQDLPFKTRLALVPLINEFLPGKVKLVYQDINRFLIDRKVLTTIRVGVSRRHDPPTAKPDAGATDTATLANDGAGDLFALLQKLMSAGAQTQPGMAMPMLPGGLPSGVGGAPGIAVPGASLPGVSVPGVAIAGGAPQVMQTLTRLQRGDASGVFLPGFDASHLHDGQVNILKEIRDTGVTGAMGHMDAMTLDIVAMVFDYILDDRRIPDAMKAQIGRLQIPVLKVAMLDRAFFSQKSHPARRLLDVLAEASMGWDEEEGHASGLYQRIDELVQRILNQFDEQVDIFATVLDEFLQYQADEKQRIDAQTGKSAQVIQQREQSEIARIVAHDEVQGHLFDQPVAEFIRAFLIGHWQRLLTHLHVRHGEGSAAWTQAIQTMDDLIWSVKPMLTAQDRKRLVELLPGLLKRLEQGMTEMGGSAEIRDQFFTGLVKCHAEAVRAGLRDSGDEAVAIPPTAPLPELPAEPEVAISMDFQDIPLLSDVREVDPKLMRELAAEPEEPVELEEITIGDVGWQPRLEDNGEPDRHDAIVKQLKRGTWIELRQDDGSLVKAKLAWISPLKGIYLFTNRLGQRAMSINGEGLAAKFRDGHVQLIDNVPLMDRAVSSLLERLQQSPG